MNVAEDENFDPFRGEKDPRVVFVARYFHDRSDHFRDFGLALGMDFLCNCIDKARQAVDAMEQIPDVLVSIDHTASLGNLFDDEKFASGFACGSIDAQLDQAFQIDVVEIRKTVRVSELASLATIAERRRFTVNVIKYLDKGWCEAQFLAK